MTLTETLEPPTPMTASRGLMHADVVARLREMILTGELAPGCRLNERVLCNSLQVSRTPLREAFRVLAAEKLVVQHAHRGASVVALSQGDIRDLFEVMSCLEGLSGSLAAVRASDQQIAEIRAQHYEMLAAHARSDLPAYYQLNRQIHDAINMAAANPALTETYRLINVRIQHVRYHSNFNRLKWDAAVQQHGAMIEALSQRDGLRLKALMEQHLSDKRDTILRAMADTGETAPAAPTLTEVEL